MLINMIATRSELKKYLKLEKTNYSVSAAQFFLSFFGISEVGVIWKYQKLLRKWEFHYNKKHRLRELYYHFRTSKIGMKYGVSIAPNCFDIGLKITHFGNILVNSNSKIGKNCLLNKNVSLISTSGTSDAPIIGDNCKIGVGSILIGGIRIANNIAIGAGSVVTKSFLDEHITIAGCPAKIISRKGIL